MRSVLSPGSRSSNNRLYAGPKEREHLFTLKGILLAWVPP
eukprot:SAG11_NODE_2285_length_3571_cov_2.005184_1_plen_40_part_00